MQLFDWSAYVASFFYLLIGFGLGYGLSSFQRTKRKRRSVDLVAKVYGFPVLAPESQKRNFDHETS